MSKDTEDLGSNIEADFADDAPAAPAPKKGKAAAPAKAAAPEKTGMPKTIRIRLEENEAIPPGGLFLGHNGNSYLLQPGMDADVPWFLIDILDNAVENVPQIDPKTRRVVGYRERMRYPYRVINTSAG